jgi:hypothetical protein
MKTNQQVLVPFLVQLAEVAAPEPAVNNDQSGNEEKTNPEWFHTRCGHPRARDD